jgi:hypothetical protein
MWRACQGCNSVLVSVGGVSGGVFDGEVLLNWNTFRFWEASLHILFACGVIAGAGDSLRVLEKGEQATLRITPRTPQRRGRRRCCLRTHPHG